METFQPIVNPTVSTSRATEFDVYLAEFGDGYEQRVGAGINNERRTASLSWNTLTTWDAAVIRDTLESYMGVTAFWYEIPTEPGLRKWVCENVSVTYHGMIASGLTAELREVRDI